MSNRKPKRWHPLIKPHVAVLVAHGYEVLDSLGPSTYGEKGRFCE